MFILESFILRTENWSHDKGVAGMGLSLGPCNLGMVITIGYIYPKVEKKIWVFGDL